MCWLLRVLVFYLTLFLYVGLMMLTFANAAGDISQKILSWTVDYEGTLYVDGHETDYANDWAIVKLTRMPNNARVVAFQLRNFARHMGLLASLDNTWSTGDPGLKCTADKSVNLNSDWTKYDYDDSDWKSAKTVKGPRAEKLYDMGTAKWVWLDTGEDEIFCRLILIQREKLRHHMIKSPSLRKSTACFHKCIEAMFCVSVKSCTDVAHSEVKCELNDNAHSATCEQLQKDAKDCQC